MTKLALYDKHEGAADREANNYFRHDYIYRKNLGTRISVGIAGIIILIIHWLRIIFVEGNDVFEINIQELVFESALFIIALVAVYSLIGTIQGTREYYHVQKRLNRYLGMLRFLENADERAAMPVTVPEEPEKERRPRRSTPLDSIGGTNRERPERIREREPLPLTDRKSSDPLANVSSRALSGGRPRTTKPLTPRPRPSAKSNELPQINLTPNDLVRPPKK